MQLLEAPDPRGTVVVFQPRWLDAAWGAERFAYRLVPVLGAIRAAGYRVRLVEEAHDAAPDDSWRDWLREASVAVVWCGEMYPAIQIPGIRAFLRLAASCDELPLVVGGGFFPLVDPEDLEIGPEVSVVVTGPGETVLPRVVDALIAGRPLREIDGIAFRESGRMVSTPAARRGALDPAWNSPLHDLDLSRYLAPDSLIFGNLEPALQILTGSGCAKRCPFCFDEQTAYGLFSASAVVDAVAGVHRRYRVRQFLLGELDFLHKIPRALEIARGLGALDPPVTWFALASVTDLARADDAAIDTLAAGGCRYLELGTESGSDRMLATLGKRHRVGDVAGVVRRLEARGIITIHNFLFGVPGETPGDRRASARLAGEISRIQPGARFHSRLYQIVPNTTMGREALRWVPRFPRTLDELEDYRQALPGHGRALPWFDPGEEERVKRFANYLLPMSLRRSGGPRRGSRERILSALARLHCTTGIHLGARWEESVYQRSCRAMEGTFVP